MNLNGLTTAEGLVFPETVRHDLNLNGLTTDKGLVLPTKIGHMLFTNNLNITLLKEAEELIRSKRSVYCPPGEPCLWQ